MHHFFKVATHKKLGRKRRRTRLCLSISLVALLYIASRVGTPSIGAIQGESYQKTLKVAVQSRGEWAHWAVDDLLQRAFPNTSILYLEPERFHQDCDIVVEGCPLFHRGHKTPCSYYDKPWIQFSAEPRAHYSEEEWCQHAKPALVRLDTSVQLDSVTQLQGQWDETPVLWTPYACQFAIDFRKQLQDRKEVLSDFLQRPYSIAWVSSNCVPQRVQMWRAIVRIAQEMGVEGVHSLGRCENNFPVDIGRGDFYFNSKLYEKYKLVLVMENNLEPGYVTEKIVQVLASGAVPIYYGHSESVKALFNTSSFLDVQHIWSHILDRDGQPAKQEDWMQIARHIIDIVLDARRMQRHLLANVFNSRESGSIARFTTVFPPECVSVSRSEMDSHYASPLLQHVLENIRLGTRRISPLDNQSMPL